MSTRNSNEQKMIDALGSAPDSTVDDLAAAVGIGRTSARKYLAALTDEGKVKRSNGGREGKRRLPDRYSPLAGQDEQGGRRGNAEEAAGGRGQSAAAAPR